MNFFKQAQEFAASANTNTPTTGSDGGSQAPASLPGGRTAPTNSELMQSGELLYGAAQGQKVDPTQLAGAASDLLGGLVAHGNLDQGTYGTYINQAEDYLNKYSGQGQSGSAAGGAPPATQVPNSQAPPSNNTSDQTVDYQSPADQTADSGSLNAPSTDDYAPDQQQGARPPSSAYDNNQY